MRGEAKPSLPTRRALLTGLVLAGGGAAVAASALKLSWAGSVSKKGAAWWDRTFLSLRNGGVAEWSATVGEAFKIPGPKGAVKLVVAAVTPFQTKGARPASLGRSSAFAVVFESKTPDFVPDGDMIYELAHATHPALAIHMGRKVVTGNRARLTAIFN